jgi:hypothetical protein
MVVSMVANQSSERRLQTIQLHQRLLAVAFTLPKQVQQQVKNSQLKNQQQKTSFQSALVCAMILPL